MGKVNLLKALDKLENNLAWLRMRAEANNMDSDDLHQVYLSYEQVATKGAAFLSDCKH